MTNKQKEFKTYHASEKKEEDCDICNKQKDKITKLGIKISRQESDKLHNKQFKKNFKRFEYEDFMDACLKCFIEGYKQGGLE